MRRWPPASSSTATCSRSHAQPRHRNKRCRASTCRTHTTSSSRTTRSIYPAPPRRHARRTRRRRARTRRRAPAPTHSTHTARARRACPQHDGRISDFPQTSKNIVDTPHIKGQRRAEHGDKGHPRPRHSTGHATHDPGAHPEQCARVRQSSPAEHCAPGAGRDSRSQCHADGTRQKRRSVQHSTAVLNTHIHAQSRAAPTNTDVLSGQDIRRPRRKQHGRTAAHHTSDDRGKAHAVFRDRHHPHTKAAMRAMIKVQGVPEQLRPEQLRADQLLHAAPHTASSAR